MYLRTHYQPTSYPVEQPMPTSSSQTHAPVRILPKTPPQQASEYASSYDGPAGHGLVGHGLPPLPMPGIGAMHGIGGMHPIGGMHAMQGLPMGAVPHSVVPPPYYGYASTTATAAAHAGVHQTASTVEETNGAAGKRRKMEMAYGSSPVPSSAVPHQFYRAPADTVRGAGGVTSPPHSHAAAAGAVRGGGAGAGGVKDVSCSIISTDGTDAEGLNGGRA
jgi:hypothetical protein